MKRSSHFVIEATRACSNHDRNNKLQLRYASSQIYPADVWKHYENPINHEKEFNERHQRYKPERRNNVRHAHTSTPPEIFTELWQSLETQIKAENDYKNGPLRWAPPKWQLDKAESERKDLFTEIDKLTTEAEISAVNQTMGEEPPEEYSDNKSSESKFNEFLAEEQLKKTVNAELVKSVVAPLLNQPQKMEQLRAQVQMDRKVERGRVAKLKTSVKEMKQRQQDRLPLLYPNINDPESTVDPRKYFDMKKNWSPPKWRGPNIPSPTRETKEADVSSTLEEIVEEDPVEPVEAVKEDERFSKSKNPDSMDKAIIEMDQRREDKIEVMERVQLKLPALTIDPQKMFDVRKF